MRVRNRNKAGSWPGWGRAGVRLELGQAGAGLRLGQTSTVILALYACSLTVNVAVGVTARVVVVVSVRVPARAAVRVATRNKAMRFISSRLLS